MTGKRNVRAGKDWEREIINVLKDRGIYPHAVSTRSESHSLDGAGIDLMNHDEYKHGVMDDTIQAKSAVKSIAYPGLLDRIRQSGRPHPVVFHRQTSRSVSDKAKGTIQVTRDKFAISYMDSYLEGMAARAAIKRIRALLAGDDTLNSPAQIDSILTDLGL